jgi:hypothetical protein
MDDTIPHRQNRPPLAPRFRDDPRDVGSRRPDGAPHGEFDFGDFDAGRVSALYFVFIDFP